MISGVVLTKNEEENIKRCLRSLDFCDEIIVVDDYSKDNTLKLASEFRVKTFKRHLNDNFAEQRNFGLTRAKYEWVLFVDADETISKFLKEEVLEKIRQEEVDGFFIRRRDVFLGKELRYGETGSVKLLRLAKKNSGKWKRKVHEYWDVKGNVGVLKNPIIHNKNENLTEFISKLNYYSTLHALENKSEKKKSNLLKIVFYPIFKFIDNYLLKLGILDGVEGFIISLMMSFHSFLSWSKQCNF